MKPTNCIDIPIFLSLNDLEKISNGTYNDKVLTQNETVKLLNCSRITLWDWRRMGKIKAYTNGETIFYKQSEINHLVRKPITKTVAENMTIRQLCEYIPSHPNEKQILRWMSSGKIPFKKSHGKIYFRKVQIDYLMEKGFFEIKPRKPRTVKTKQPESRSLWQKIKQIVR